MSKNISIRAGLSKGLAALLCLALLSALAPAARAATGVTVTTSEKEFGAAPTTVRVSVGKSFQNAAVVSIAGGGQTTGAVVDNGCIEFYVRQHGDFTVTDTGKTVASISLSGNLESTSPEGSTYRGNGNGTSAEPLTVLADFANVASDVKKLQATWKSYNVFAGFDTDGTAARNADAVKKVLIEDRDETTGKLLGSFYIDGALWKETSDADKGPYYMNYLLDPTDQSLTSGYALDNHYSYTANAPGGEARRKIALDLLKKVRASKDSALFVQSRLRDYAGPITFRIYVGELGKFVPGDTVSITYLLGSSNRNVYHGIKPSEETLLADEPTYSKFYQDAGMKAVVDKDGYLTFTLYNGGYFALTKVTGSASDTVWKMPDFSSAGSGGSSNTKDIYFLDVPIKHWAYVDIYAMAQEGIIGGYPDGSFKPEANISRAEFLKLLLASLKISIQSGQSGFADADGSWAQNIVYTASKLGIISGKSATEFGATDNVTREQMALMICRAKALKPLTADGFTDDDQVSSWAKGYIGACAAAKYVGGYSDGSFKPQQLLTRAEAAAVVHKIFNIG